MERPNYPKDPIEIAILEKESFQINLLEKLGRKPENLLIAQIKRGSYKLNEFNIGSTGNSNFGF